MSFCSKEWLDGAVAPTRDSAAGRRFGVISHCRSDTRWVQRFLNRSGGLEHMHIVSKCGHRPNWESPSVSHFTSPNVGRCDHTYAQWIVENARELHWNDVVFFMKDTHLVHQRDSTFQTFEAMGRMVGGGFVCATRPRRLSIFHNTSVLGRFIKTKYRGAVFHGRKSLREWWTAMHIDLPEPFVPVCYGGHFAATGRQLQGVDMRVWKAILRSLERGDSIAEGHLAERSWAALLSPRLGCEFTGSLRSHAGGTLLGYSSGLQGALTSCVENPPGTPSGCA